MDGIARRAGTALAKNARQERPELLKLQTDLAMKLGGAFGVLFALPPDAWHYAGKDVKLNAAEPSHFLVQTQNRRQMHGDLRRPEHPRGSAGRDTEGSRRKAIPSREDLPKTHIPLPKG